MKFERQRFQNGCIQLKKRTQGPDLWTLRYRVTLADGRRAMKRVIIGPVTKFKTESQARAAAQGILLSVNAGSPLAGPVTFGVLIDRYIAEEFPTRYSTAHGYRSMLETHIRPRWGACLLEEVKPLAVESWLKGLKLSPKTRSNVKSLMHLLFSCAMRWELMDIRENPMSLVRVKGASKRIRESAVLTVEQFQAVLALLDEPYRTMATVAACLGLRISEVLGLQWSDFDWEKHEVQIARAVVQGRIGDTKTEYSRRSLPMAPELESVIFAHRERLPEAWLASPWVFPSWRTGRVHNASALRRTWLVTAGNRLGIKNLGWHSFRHSYSTLLNAHGTDAKVQQELLRHSDIRTTLQIYTRAVPDQLRQAHGKVVSLLIPSQAVN